LLRGKSNGRSKTNGNACPVQRRDRPYRGNCKS
jgi:hypothetical protein